MRRIAAATLAQIYRQHAPALLLFARQFTSSAEDVVQEAFIKLSQTQPAPDEAVPWLYCVVKREALDANRRWFRRRRREAALGRPESWFSSVDDAIDARTATQLLAELPLEHREVIVARIWSGMTFEQIAQSLDMSLATAHRRFRDGLETLRTRLEGSWPKSMRMTPE